MRFKVASNHTPLLSGDTRPPPPAVRNKPSPKNGHRPAAHSAGLDFGPHHPRPGSETPRSTDSRAPCG